MNSGNHCDRIQTIYLSFRFSCGLGRSSPGVAISGAGRCEKQTCQAARHRFEHIPNEAIAMLVASPSELNAANKIELFPTK